VVRAGAKTGIATPVNDALTKILTDLTTGNQPITDYAQKPDAFLREFKQ
jgi:hypothetical protein